MRRLNPHSATFTLVLASLVTLASFATDMGLPVLAATAESLHVPSGKVALSLSVFMAGFALGPLLFAPLSDARGRRPILLAGAGMFGLFGALAALSQSLNALLLWRVLMGIGAGACQVTVIAMIRDLFSGVEARVKQSYVNLAAGIAPVIAPTVGVAIASLGGWRGIYAVLGIGGVLLFTMVFTHVTESLQARASRSASEAVGSYVHVVRHRVTFGYILVIALNFGCLFAYVTGSSLVLIGLLGVSRRMYGLLFAITALGLMIGALSNARLTRMGMSHSRLIAWGLGAIVVTSLILLVFTVAGFLPVWVLVPLAFIGFIGQGVVRPNATQGALEPMATVAGVASAVMTGVQTLLGAASSALVAALFDGRSAIAMTAMMAVCAVLSALTYWLVVVPAERPAYTIASDSAESTMPAMRKRA